MKKALLKDTIKEIIHTRKRFLSILLIVLLGVGFFAGIKATSPDMKETIDKYFDTENVMDIQVMSNVGLALDDIDELKKIENIEDLEAAYYTDAIINTGKQEVVVRLESLTKYVNKLEIVEGRLPEDENECVVESKFLTDTNHKVGDKLTIEVENNINTEIEPQNLLKQEEVTIVGSVKSPLYISRDRGTSKIGSGKISYYMYVPIENFNTDIRTVVYITVEGSKELKTYEQEYEDYLQTVKEEIEKISEQRKAIRYNELYYDLNQKIQTAQNELDKQKEEFQKQIKLIEEQEKSQGLIDSLEKLQEQLNTLIENGGDIEKLKEENELYQLKTEAEEKISLAQKQIDKAREQLENIVNQQWYILDRNSNIGYVSYMQDTERIDNIAKVFPLVFFIVATLISLTTMTRMVDEQRVQIGTLKALGYNKVQIAAKYIIYAFLATIIGGAIGTIIGFKLIPSVIFNVYTMMYTVPNIVLQFNMQYALIGILVAIACTVGASIYSCAKSLVSMPANLMRPKSPKAGKRVLIEKMSFIWKKLDFTQKVTVRNLFRYKKRFLMTIIGVAGCTALIIAGFGLRDAISSMLPTQYGEIFKYNLQVTLQDDLKLSEVLETYSKIIKQDVVKNATRVNIKSVKVVKDNNNQSIQLIVQEDVEKLKYFITLKDRKSEDIYTLNNEGVIITEKLAKLLDIKLGDTITIENADNIQVQVKVESITENYLRHYIYMSPELYKELYQEKMVPNTILAITDKMSEKRENYIGRTILENDDTISELTFTSLAVDIFTEVMENMEFVVWVLIMAAGLLALVVLFNLSNSNISERIRELATIKVLGFYDKEVYDYVAKETTILTIIGTLLGLVAGYFLTLFVIKTCEVDMLMFSQKIEILSYLYAIVITAIFAAIVNIGTYFALKKINMIESLKNVE